MRQKQINKNVDYLYNLQKDETVHQNHRVTWILSAQALLFTGLCALAHNTLIDIIDCYGITPRNIGNLFYVH